MPVASFVATGTACGRHPVAARARGVSLPPKPPIPSPARFLSENHALRSPRSLSSWQTSPGSTPDRKSVPERGRPVPEKRHSWSPSPSPARFLSENHVLWFPGRFPRGKRPPVPRASCPQDRFSPTAKAFPHPLPLDNGKRLCIYWKRHGTPYRKRSGSAPLARFPPAAAMAVWNTSGQGEPEKEQ